MAPMHKKSADTAPVAPTTAAALTLGCTWLITIIGAAIFVPMLWNAFLVGFGLPVLTWWMGILLWVLLTAAVGVFKH